MKFSKVGEMKNLLKLSYKLMKTSLGAFSPFELNFAITYRCNSKCKTCNIWRLRPKNELSLEEIKRFVKNIKFIHWIRLTGGEPFLRNDYTNIVKNMNERLDLYLLTTPTNGLLPSLIEKRVKEVLRFLNGRYVITVSLDGPQKTHDFIRGVPGNWKKSLETFKRLKKLESLHRNFKVLFGYTISPFNVGKFEETVKAVKSYFPSVSQKDFHINLFQLSEVYYHINPENIRNVNLVKFSKAATQEIKRMLPSRRRLGIVEFVEKKYMHLGIKYLKNFNTPITCNVYNLSAFIDPYGNVYPCSIFNKRLGNLRERDYNLLEILTSEKSLTVRKLIKEKKCPQCWTPCEAHQMIMSNWLKI